VVETATLYNKGVKTGAIDDDAIMVGIPYGWRLIEAPPPTSKQDSLIFWEPSSAEDREPAFEKVVSYLSYLSLTFHHVSTDRRLYPWCKVHEPHIW
jgi:hypothetical protein